MNRINNFIYVILYEGYWLMYLDNNNWVWNQQSAHGLYIQTQDYEWQVPCKWLSFRWWCEGLSAWVWNVPDRTFGQRVAFRQSSRSCRSAWHTTTGLLVLFLCHTFFTMYFWKKSILLVHPDFYISLYISIFLNFWLQWSSISSFRVHPLQNPSFRHEIPVGNSM